MGEYWEIQTNRRLFFNLSAQYVCRLEVIAHINIFKSGELNGQHMFHLGTYSISTTGVMNTSSERPEIPTTITTTPEPH